MKKKRPDFKRKHLDTFLYYYKCLVTNNESDLEETLDALSIRILGGANSESTAFRTYKARLEYDELIREDVDSAGNKKWVATGKGLTYSYRWNCWWDKIKFTANLVNIVALFIIAIYVFGLEYCTPPKQKDLPKTTMQD